MTEHINIQQNGITAILRDYSHRFKDIVSVRIGYEIPKIAEAEFLEDDCALQIRVKTNNMWIEETIGFNFKLNTYLIIRQCYYIDDEEANPKRLKLNLDRKLKFELAERYNSLADVAKYLSRNCGSYLYSKELVDYIKSICIKFGVL